ncbi:MAG: LysR substrate-binding domain-containing protein [Rhodococcus sp. (in: high G+C Gram-positive bacteria)]|uniref:LysR substrate-binding domain-containing protein n=1 Tax=Rhodococcus sp. TaxID=1831 RepID=UPI003BB7A966
MTLDQLNCFVALARVGHFTRAANEVGIAQPSFSRQIAALEKAVGVRLFDRTPGAVELSAAGEALLPVAARMIADRATAYRRIDELTGLTRGRLRLGATPSLCTTLVAEVLDRYRTAYPGVDLLVAEAGSRTLTTRLARGELDVALVIAEQTDHTPGLDLTPILREELVVVSSTDHPAPAVHRTLTLMELAALPLVLCHDGYDLRVVLDQALAAASLEPRIVLEGAELGAVLRFVARGIGVTVAPAMAALHYPGLRATRLTSPELHRTIVFAHRADLAPSHAAVAFRTLVGDAVDVLIADDDVAFERP